jgi:hypothetical protein
MQLLSFQDTNQLFPSHQHNGHEITTYVIRLSPSFVFRTADTVAVRNLGSENHLRPFIRDLLET